MPTVDTYTIDAAHGSDDCTILDWNNVLYISPSLKTDPSYSKLLYDWNPNDTLLRWSAPGTFDYGEGGDGYMDACTARGGLLFRSVAIPSPDSLVSAVVRIYLMDWDPEGYTDPGTGFPAAANFRLYVYGCLRAHPIANAGINGTGGYSSLQQPSFGSWGPLTAWPLGAQPDFLATIWSSTLKPGENFEWYPTAWDTQSRNVPTTARTIAPIPRGPAGYVDIDVTSVVSEIISYNYAAPNFSAGTQYTYGGAADALAGAYTWNAKPASLVMNAGNLYCCVKSGTNTTGPTGTTGIEYPDGNVVGKAAWRYIQTGNIRNWQSGDNIALLLQARPPITLVAGQPPYYNEQNWDESWYKFARANIPGYRHFAAGDLGDAGKYPQLVVTWAVGSTNITSEAGTIPVSGGVSALTKALLAVPITSEMSAGLVTTVLSLPRGNESVQPTPGVATVDYIPGFETTNLLHAGIPGVTISLSVAGVSTRATGGSAALDIPGLLFRLATGEQVNLKVWTGDSWVVVTVTQ